MWRWAKPAFPLLRPPTHQGPLSQLGFSSSSPPDLASCTGALWENMCSLEPLTASAVLVLPASQPLTFWLQTAGQVLNESAGPHKAGASAHDSYPLPCLPAGWVMVQIQSLGFHFGPAKYLLCHLARATYILCGPDPLFFKRGNMYGLLRKLRGSAAEPGCRR